MDYIHFLFPDPKGRVVCTTCRGFCSGHHGTNYIDISDKDAVKSLVMPPSIVLKTEFSKAKEITDEFIM